MDFAMLLLALALGWVIGAVMIYTMENKQVRKLLAMNTDLERELIAKEMELEAARSMPELIPFTPKTPSSYEDDHEDSGLFEED